MKGRQAIMLRSLREWEGGCRGGGGDGGMRGVWEQPFHVLEADGEIEGEADACVF